MPAYAVIGGQWGDEGKGKVVDYLAETVQAVVRFGGGNNAGHTVVNPRGKFQLHLVPSGICWPEIDSIIGNGVVVDPDGLMTELADLAARGIDTNRVLVSERAHVIMPYHVLLDSLEEEARGSEAIGTTGCIAYCGLRVNIVVALTAFESITSVSNKKSISGRNCVDIVVTHTAIDYIGSSGDLG